MDATDMKAVARLQVSGRESWATLGIELGMTGPAAAERVRRLEADGVIRGYAALIDPPAVGASLTAFVAVTLERPGNRTAFLRRVQRLTEVQECHHIAGDYDYLLKVRCAGTGDLDRILTDELKSVQGVVSTRTTVVLRTLKESVVVPLPDMDVVST
jgi:Lrp/AsnC family transcriptional regulator, leucine-responsive regulatory protein